MKSLALVLLLAATPAFAKEPNTAHTIKCVDTANMGFVEIQVGPTGGTLTVREAAYIFPGAILGALIDDEIDKDFMATSKGKYLQLKTPVEFCDSSKTNPIIATCSGGDGPIELSDGDKTRVIPNANYVSAELVHRITELYYTTRDEYVLQYSVMDIDHGKMRYTKEVAFDLRNCRSTP